MSLRSLGKLLGCVGLSAFLWSALPAWGWAQSFGAPVAASACGSCGPCASFCQSFHCPPAYKHCYEGAPHICWHRGCPHPICNPCDLPHFGYFETCWSPFPFTPTWAHCIVPPPAAFVKLNPMVHPNIQPRMLPPVGTPAQPKSITPIPPMPMPMGSSEELNVPRRIENDR
jgi:hypothetical protein